MQNLLNNLTTLLQNDERLISQDKILLKNKIQELVIKNDEKIIKSLLSNEEIKKHFFIKIDDVLIFNKDKFIHFISSKEFLPDSFTSFKNKIGLTIDKKYSNENNNVVLVWPYKDCVLEGGMEKEDEKRNEIFFNEILAPDDISRLFEPKVLINFKLADIKGQHQVEKFNFNENGTIKDNLIIKGNNLIALNSIKKLFSGKIKLIYIDPPYNTGNDSFKYNDSFNHSTWLSFMKNRLEVAKELLSEDGAFFIQIDYHEIGYLNVLLDEIFGKNNFIQLISVKTASPAGFKTVNPGPIDITEYILFYTKNRSVFEFKRCYVPVGYDENYNMVIMNIEDDPVKWKLESLANVIYKENNIEIGKTSQEAIKNAKKVWGSYWKLIRKQMMANYALKNANRTVSIRDPHKPSIKLKTLLDKSKIEREKIFLYEKNADDDNKGTNTYIINGGALAFYSNKIKNIDGKLTPTELLTDLWLDLSWDGIAMEGGVKLKNGKKPEKLIERIINMVLGNGKGIVMDFFMGSGTTCAVAHKMDKQYIGIEQLNYGENDSYNRLKNVLNGDTTGVSKSLNWNGGGSFIYCEIMKLNEIYIDMIKNAKAKNELKEIWEIMKEKSFLNYKVDVKKIDKNSKEFDDLSIENQKEFLIECLDKNHLYVNLSEIDDKDYKISQEDKNLNKMFYGLE